MQCECSANNRASREHLTNSNLSSFFSSFLVFFFPQEGSHWVSFKYTYPIWLACWISSHALKLRLGTKNRVLTFIYTWNNHHMSRRRKWKSPHTLLFGEWIWTSDQQCHVFCVCFFKYFFYFTKTVTTTAPCWFVPQKLTEWREFLPQELTEWCQLGTDEHGSKWQCELMCACVCVCVCVNSLGHLN